MIEILGALFLLADVGPKPLSYAGQPTPLKDLPGVEVEMAAEDVRLTLHRSRLDVQATFTLVNHGGDVQMEEGFPVGPFETMKGFSILADGAALPFTRVDRATGKDKEAHDFWYVWTAPFKAGARHTHVVTYTLDLAHQRFYHQTGYVLHTGAAWKNAIGKAVVTLTFGDGVSAAHLRGVQPFEAGRVAADRVVWTFENLEPTKAHDILIRYDLDPWTEDVARLRADTSWNGRRALAATLRELPTYQGRTAYTPEELRGYLDALGGLIAEGRIEDGKYVFPTTDPDLVYVAGVATPTGFQRLRYYLLEDDLLRMFQGFLDEATAVARAHPAEPKAKEVLAAYRGFLARLLTRELHLDYRTMAGGGRRPDPRAGKILPARELTPEERRTLEAKLADADALLK